MENLEEILNKGGIKTSQIDRIFNTINTSDKNIFLYGWHDKYKEYLVSAYTTQYPSFISSEETGVILPSLKIRLDQYIIDTRKLDELIGKSLYCRKTVYEKQEALFRIIKDLQIKKIFVEEAFYLSDMHHWDISKQEVLIPNKKNTEFFQPCDDERTYSFIKQKVFKNFEYFANLFHCCGITTVFMGHRTSRLPVGKETLLIKKVKGEPKTTIKDYNDIFSALKKNIDNSVIKVDFFEIKKYCVKHKLNVHDIFATFVRAEEISLVASIDRITLKMFINCFERYVFKLRNNHSHSSFCLYKS